MTNRLRRMPFVRSLLCIGVAVSAAGCRPKAAVRPAPAVTPVQQPADAAVPHLGPEFMLTTESFRTFASALRSGQEARLELPFPVGLGTATFTFQLGRRPVAQDYEPDLLFASGTAENSDLRARVTLVDDRELLLTVFADNTGIYTARIAPGVVSRYKRLGSSFNDTGPPGQTRPRSLPALRSAASASVSQLRIVIVIGSEMIDSPYHGNETMMKNHTASLIYAANDILGRDLGFELNLQGTAFRREELDGYDTLSEVEEVVQTAATDNGWAMDLGHFIDHGGNGESDIGTVCQPSSKARAYSYIAAPDPISEVLLTFLHEVGHQLGAAHSFNMTSTFRDPAHAYEPGRGKTIMSYAISPQTYFHADSIQSIDEIVPSNVASNPGCGVPPSSTTSVPLVRVAAADTHVPTNTPFEVEALPDLPSSAYRWDEYDLASNPDTSPPFFESNPQRSRTRIYPPLAALLNGAPVWPTGRLTFRVLGFVGFDHEHKDMTVNIENAPQFAILSAGCPVTCVAGGSFNVTWRVGATNRSPFRVRTLRVEVFNEARPQTRVVVASGVPNTGHATFIIPAGVPSTRRGRFMLHAEEGILFALSKRITVR